MSNDLISSDRPFSGPESERLHALLDTIVPASEDGAMPSAASVDFDSYLAGEGASSIPLVQSMLARLDAGFAEASASVRHAILVELERDNPTDFSALVFHVYNCYYQNRRVREAIGVVPGALFPNGATIEANDLSLLDPVLAGSHQYRRA